MMLPSFARAAKMDSRLILVVIGVIAMAFGRSEAIKCYQCSSFTDSRCLDPFNSNGVATCQGGGCIKGWSTSSSRSITLVLVYHSHAILLIHYSVAHIRKNCYYSNI